jgi:hypothetical protein
MQQVPKSIPSDESSEIVVWRMTLSLQPVFSARTMQIIVRYNRNL